MFNIFRSKVTDNQVREVIKPMLAEMEERVNWLQSMQKLDVKDGDIVIFRYPHVMRYDAHKNLRDALKETLKNFGYDVHVMVLEDGLEIGVLRKEGL